MLCHSKQKAGLSCVCIIQRCDRVTECVCVSLMVASTALTHLHVPCTELVVGHCLMTVCASSNVAAPVVPVAACELVPAIDRSVCTLTPPPCILYQQAPAHGQPCLCVPLRHAALPMRGCTVICTRLRLYASHGADWACVGQARTAAAPTMCARQAACVSWAAADYYPPANRPKRCSPVLGQFWG